MKAVERFRVEGRRALVTGAGRGLGKAFALALAEAGADVATVDFDGKSAEQTAEEIRALGRKALALEADLRRSREAERMVAAVVSEWEGLDVAVNNAGVSLPIKAAFEISEQEWDWLVDLNLKGTFFCAQAEGRAMRAGGYGKIINIASICGYAVWPEPQAVYSVSKAGIVHLTRCLAAEWIRHGIRVNSISPGVTRTPELFEQVIPVFLKTAPIDRIAGVEDLQGAVLYLASPASDFMVGADLVIDGGYTLM
ncbi:MAG: SDR family oxidoreductase [Spirochaetales bacterium]|nr:SDR family oxidoreductase [Spirochaetales bacterium]